MKLSKKKAPINKKKKQADLKSNLNPKNISFIIEFPLKPVKIPLTSFITIFFVFLGIFALYINNLMPGVPGGDSGELITSSYLLGISHPPGYPLYNLLGKLFSLIPIGSIAWRINCSSAFFNLGASFFIYLSLYKLTKYWPAALFASLFFSLSPMILEYSLKAEVFPLNNLFAALIIYLLIVSREYYLQYQLKVLDINTYQSKCRAIFYIILFVCGLALTNHHTIILLAPGVIIALYSYNKSVLLEVKSLSIALGLFILGLSIYLYIPIRAHAEPFLNWGNPQTMQDFIRLITRADYGSLNLMNTNQATYDSIEKYSFYLSWLIKQANYLGIILCMTGLFFLICQKEKTLSFILILSYILTSFVFLFIANIIKNAPVVLGAIERFYMLPMVFIALFFGLGVYYIAQSISLFYYQKPKKGILLHTIIFILIASSILLNIPNIKEHNSSIFNNYGYNVLNSLEPNSVLLTQGDTPTHVLYYIQQVEGLRKDVTILVKHHFNHLWYQQHIKKFYPSIKIPDTEADNESAIKQFIIANLNKHPLYDTDFITKIPPPTAGYQLISKGIVTKIVNNNNNFNEQELKQTKSVWNTYNTTDLSISYPLNSLEKELKDLYASFHSVFAFQAMQIGFYDLALNEYDKAIHLNPALAGAYKNTGIIYDLHKKDPLKAIHYFKKYISLEPNDRDPTMLSLIQKYS